MATAEYRTNYYGQELVEEDNDLDISIGQYRPVYDEAQPAMIDEATLVAMQQKMAQQAAFAQIPDAVKRFILHFHQSILDGNVSEISAAYESGWNKLTEKYYAKSEWPDAELFAPLVNDDQVFLTLYRELYYRHVYSRLSPNIDDRFHSYENSCELFNYVLNSDGPVPLELPDQWLWDIIDEFIYQYQSFCVWRSKVKNKNDEEKAMLADGSQIWSTYSVLNVLYSLIQKSKINENLAAAHRGASAEEIAGIVGEFGVRPLYRTLGYFSLIGLLRVHTLLGDYTLAVKVMDNIELNPKAFFMRVTACHVATYYYVAFCYLALRRYPDANRTLVNVLNFISRMRPYHTRSYQYDQINKTADRMYALLTIGISLSPTRLDENTMIGLKERCGDQYAKMQRGEEGLSAFEELFLYACPKFITSVSPPYEDPDLLALYIKDPPVDAPQRHLALFMTDVRAKLSVPTLRSFLKLYSSLDAKKLANFLDANEEEIVQQMMVLKQASRSIGRAGLDGGRLLDGEMISTSDLDFAINENMVHIVESTIGRRYASLFIKNTEYAQRIFDHLRSSPLPISKSTLTTVEPIPAAPPQPPKPKVAWAK
ncbi:eukaryotic translation initiation factor 3 subunit 6 [Cantharellus anzutake]|uniref:eukaryotic translation initiation factor 3 subunit 6 n=1 Tax=Cantharellus anzutake TaxID=1750568 RepID=UPI00190512DB|nr:eukaryotic translation initiation factor 3 subunit 6 [Cantharellus anzutake]KAF8331311.1 eukaryotic translation initiation factor 3 subunit 6 [Cantharellus anzutake]